MHRHGCEEGFYALDGADVGADEGGDVFGDFAVGVFCQGGKCEGGERCDGGEEDVSFAEGGAEDDSRGAAAEGLAEGLAERGAEEGHEVGVKGGIDTRLAGIFWVARGEEFLAAGAGEGFD